MQLVAHALRLLGSTCKASSCTGAVSVTGVVYVPNENAMLSAIQQGPLSIAVNDDPIQFYKSGVFNDPTCKTNVTNHAILAVGYGTDSTSGLQYW